jgi:photosystem II stability/assembly factor-like uncharacterized protein
MNTRTRIRGVACALALALLGLDSARGALDPARPASWDLADADLYGIEARGDTLWAVGYWGTVRLSSDGGATWQRVETPVTESLYAVSFADAQHGWAVGGHGVILRTSDGGRSWERQAAQVLDELGEAAPLDTSLLGVSAVSAQEAWAVGDFGVILHTRDGVAWEQLKLSPESFGDENLPERILNSVHFVSPQSGFIAGEFGTLLRTSDGGATWTGRHQLMGAPAELYLFNVEGSGGDDAQLAAVGLEGTVLVSQNGGESWESRAVSTGAALFALDWRGERGVVVGDRGVIFTTVDAGRSWRAAERAPYLGWLAGVRYADDQTLYAVGERGVVLRSRDAGQSFEVLGTKSTAPAAPVE